MTLIQRTVTIPLITTINRTRFLRPAYLNSKIEMTKVIGTHSGTFHCDEALAVFLLRQTSTYTDASLRRTREGNLLSTCDVVVDVGAVYDPEKQLFDHHQRGFDEVFGGEFKTKLSSAGLIYKHFGKEVISRRLNLDLNDSNLQTLYLKLYRDFIEPLDGGDNGIPRYPPDVQPKYQSGGTDLPSRVARLNPAWNETTDGQKMDALFEKASLLAGTEFLQRVDSIFHTWFPARELVVNALKRRFDVHPSGQILVFDTFCPWKAHLLELEKESPVYSFTRVLYVLYPDDLGATWRVQAVPISFDSFENRKSLPESWRGLRDAELTEACGVPGCVFVHLSGFTGGNKTKEGAMEMAKLALEM